MGGTWPSYRIDTVSSSIGKRRTSGPVRTVFDSFASERTHVVARELFSSCASTFVKVRSPKTLVDSVLASMKPSCKGQLEWTKSVLDPVSVLRVMRHVWGLKLVSPMFSLSRDMSCDCYGNR